jgi:PIN domain nuclease of toxin-antitoxin system
MILLDTHTLIWLSLDPSKIPKSTLILIEKSSRNKTLFISDISFWEVANAVKKKRLIIPIDLDVYFNLILETWNINVIPISHQIAILSTNLVMHKDPADRLICATAIMLNAKLISKDKLITKANVVEVLW